ncbi:MAG: transcriptional regulator, PucR family [Firmicutes bacterium]|nr:transcriptional regulator, PucR family [Bacillota bacterium]
MKIKDVLQLFQEQSISLVAGANGLNNIVESVNIMDAPDIENWARTGDLILTTAYTIKDNPLLQEQLLKQLKTRGCAGLGIKTKRFLPEIPTKMLDMANDLGFPILELPLNLSLAEIMNPIISNIVNHQSLVLQRSNEIYKSMTTVAMNGGGLPAIISCLGKLTQCPVGCYDVNGMLINHWLPDTISEQDTNILASLKNLLHIPQPTSSFSDKNLFKEKNSYVQSITVGNHSYLKISARILSSNEFFGYITIFQRSSSFSDITLAAIEHACTVATLEFLKQKAVTESHKLYSRDILEYLLFSDLNQPNMSGFIDTSKLAQAKVYKCLIIEPDTIENEYNLSILSVKLYKIAQQIIAAKYSLSLVSERAGKIIVLLASTNNFNEENEMYEKLHQSLSNIDPLRKVSIGIGTPELDFRSVRQSFHDALACLKLGRLIKGPGNITHPYDIAGYSILLSDKETSHILTQLYDPIIDKLKKSDQSLGTEFLKTLEKYLEFDKNLVSTAKELYVHRNTLANRLERIADISGLDLENREQLFCFRLALRRRKILKE